MSNHCNPTRWELQQSRCCDCSITRSKNKQRLKKRSYNNMLLRRPCLLSLVAVSAVTSAHFLNWMALVEASSSSSGSSSNNNLPFMVMSEITVHSDGSESNNNIDDDNRSDILNDADVQTAAEASNSDNSNAVDSNNEEMESSSAASLQTNVNSAVDKSASINNNAAVDNGGSGSDTDGEDDEDDVEKKTNANNFVEDTSLSIQQQQQQQQPPPQQQPQPIDTSMDESTNSQPLRTLQKLQAMLDDSDYATHTVSSESVTGNSSSRNVVNEEPSSPPPVTTAAATTATVIKSTNPPPPPPSQPDKLWTSKDRAKYRRTRRTEKQRQQQHEQRAREIRDIQRQRIIREERERKELEELRRKQAELLERQGQDQQRRQQMQQQQVIHQYEEATTDFTDDDTDGTDGKGFELPNNPVYLSDGEATETDGEDFSEEKDDVLPQRRPQALPNQPQPQRYQQPYQYNNYQRPPPQTNTVNNNAYPNYHQYRQPPPQAGQQPNVPYSPPQHPNMPQYQFSSNQQQQMQQQQMQYDQNYAAWAQAAANGYFYPPPTPPGSYPQQYPYTNNQQNQPPPNQPPPNQPFQQQFYPHQQQPYQYPNPHQTAMPPGQRWTPQQPQQQPPQYKVEDRVASHATNTALQENIPPSVTDDTQLQPPVQSNENTIGQAANDGVVSPTSTSTSTQQMTVQSSVISPPSPLIPPMPMQGPINAEGPYCELENDAAVMIAGASSRITFDSVQKLGFSMLGVALMSYCAVSPRTLPFPEYNRLFLHNLSIVWLAAWAPIISLIAVYDGKYNSINTAIGTFYISLTLGYTLAFLSEVAVTTIVRLGVFKIWEPDIFSLTSEVPTPILPWVLREKAYKPKRITLFVADFASSCIAAPIIEEVLKLKICQWTSKLPRNFKAVKVQKGKRKRSKKTVAQAVRSIDAPQVTNVNCYVVQMLAASLGLKLFDVTRRILMYTKKSDEHKHFFAVARGVYPIHELCGTMTALLLARRDVVGIDLSIWKIVGPAIVIHGLANFRGMKPIFKWNASTPWSEMQIPPFKAGSDFSFTHLIPTSYAKIVWTTILLRVFGFCVKNYYLTGRQAMKRTTTYSGKLHAFEAKLHTDSFLKKAKKDQS
eukprot:scaffold4726_cov103-Skeletonema_marinoi.AAC.2